MPAWVSESSRAVVAQEMAEAAAAPSAAPAAKGKKGKDKKARIKVRACAYLTHPHTWYVWVRAGGTHP